MISATNAQLGDYFLYCEGNPRLLFTENETNNQRLFGTANPTPYVKDGINDCVVADRQSAVNSSNTGTKAAAHYRLRVPARGTAVVRLRLSNTGPGAAEPFGPGFAEILDSRRHEADAFYRAIIPAGVGEDAANVMRQALAGMLWSKQYFFFEVEKWLREHGLDPLRLPPRQLRNREWFHMMSDDVISMPDKWEYPWFAAWDLAFHTLALSVADVDFAKQQLDLLLDQVYLHPTGQIPAYEWNFSDVNPPVHAWATIFLYRTEQALRGKTDFDFLIRMFGKLTSNFGWWINRKDRFGRNLFEGGFLGLDNIGVFDRSAPLPTGGYLEQADGTAWVALFSQNRRRAGGAPAGLRRPGNELPGAVRIDCACDERHRAGRHVGRGGRLLLRRAAHARRQCHSAQGSLDGGPLAALRHDGRRKVAARAGPQADRATVRAL